VVHASPGRESGSLLSEVIRRRLPLLRKSCLSITQLEEAGVEHPSSRISSSLDSTRKLIIVVPHSMPSLLITDTQIITRSLTSATLSSSTLIRVPCSCMTRHLKAGPICQTAGPSPALVYTMFSLSLSKSLTLVPLEPLDSHQPSK